MKRRLILFLITAAGLIATLLADRYYQREMAEDNAVALTRSAEVAADSLQDALLVRAGAVRDLRAFMLSSATLPDQTTFQQYARRVLEHAPELRALQYADSDLTITYVYPLEGNEAAVGVNLLQRPAAGDAQAAIAARQMTINDPVPLVQGPLGAVIRVPLFRDDAFLGLAQGVMEIEALLEDVGGQLDDSFVMQLRDSRGNVFWGPDILSGATRSLPLEAGLGSWTLTVAWAQGAPAAAPEFRALLWGLSAAFFVTLLFFVNNAMTNTDRLAEAVRARTESLSQSEEKYRTLVEQAHDAILITDAQGNYLEANEAALDMLGYAREELLARNARDVVAPFEQEKTPLRLARIAGGETVLSERWLQRKDGSLLLVESSAVSLPDGRLLGIVRDVTERREVEQALRRGEAILQAVSFAAEQFLRSATWQEQIDEVLARLGQAADVSRAYIFQNDETAGGQPLAHYRYEWVAPGIARHVDDPDLQVLPYEEADAGALRTTLSQGGTLSGPVTQFEPQMQAILRAQEIVSLVVVPIFAGDDWWGFMGFDDCERVRTWSEAEIDALRTAADILGAAISNAGLFEESRRLLQQTREQAHQMQQIMETVPDGVMLLNAQRRILVTNPPARAYLAQLSGATVGDVLERVDGQRLDDLLAADEDAEPWHEVQPRGSDDLFMLAARSIEADNQTVGWVLVIRDVTAERQRQAYLQRQERLATVGQLAAGIAHDFNNIMAVIILYSESLQRNPDDERREIYLQTLRDQAQHAADLVSQILDFSRRAVMERGALDLLPFVRQVVKILERTLPEMITVSLTTVEGAYAVDADPSRLQQVLMNLALNARDAMPNGGELHIRLAPLTIAPEQRPPLPEMAPGEWIRLTVRDSGTGIEPQHQTRIFEPFFTTKQPGRGTGLGLAQVYGIVKQHGGEIDVQSEPGAGTSFSIYLPVLAPGVSYDGGGDAAQLAPPSEVQETVLLVEDNELTRQAICDTLQEAGYQVLVTATGQEALALFAERQQEIDLVLSDIYMPQMNGLELRQRLSQLDPQVKILLMTGYPREVGAQTLLEDGAVAWIRKPFSQEEIGARIRALLGGKEGAT